MVGKWRQRFVARHVDGLLDEPRSGGPRRIRDAKIEQVIVTTLESMPSDATRSLAARAGLSQSTISRVWRAFGLQPHRSETCKLSRDPQFIEKLRDIVGLYLKQPERALVPCVDEKSQIQALDCSQPLLPMRPGQVKRRTHDYVRHGTTSLFAARRRHRQVIGECHRRHRAIEFRTFLDTIEANVSPVLDVHLVLDNYAAHKTAAIQRWLAGRPRFHVHFTPTSASWLNLVESFFSILTRSRFSAAFTAAPANSRPRSKTTCARTTLVRAPSCGPRPPTKSSNRSPDIACESLVRGTAGG